MSINNILFLKEEMFISTMLVGEEELEIYSIKSEINRLAKKYFFTIAEYRKLVRKKIGLKNKIPIYFSEKLMFFNLKSGKSSYLINYFNILKICYEENIIIIFKNGFILELNVSKRNLLNEIKKIDKVLDYINNL